MKSLYCLLLSVLLACSCTTKKRLARLQLTDSIRLHSEIRMQVAQQLHQWENLSVCFRQTEVKDTAGRICTTTDIVFDRRRENLEGSIREKTVSTDSSARTHVDIREQSGKRPSLNTNLLFVVLGGVLAAIVYIRMRRAGCKK